MAIHSGSLWNGVHKKVSWRGAPKRLVYSCRAVSTLLELFETLVGVTTELLSSERGACLVPLVASRSVELSRPMAKRVLIVDDDPIQRRILEEHIKRLGYETKTAQGGEQALQILEGPDSSSISLVFLDLVMPGVDGMAVLDRIGLKSGMPPIIVQTAQGSIDAAISAMRAGAVDFIVKPASPERLDVSMKSARSRSKRCKAKSPVSRKKLRAP